MQHKSSEEREELVKSLAALDGADTETQPGGYQGEPCCRRRRSKTLLFGQLLACFVIGSSIGVIILVAIHGGIIFLPLLFVPILAMAILATSDSSR